MYLSRWLANDTESALGRELLKTGVLSMGNASSKKVIFHISLMTQLIEYRFESSV